MGLPKIQLPLFETKLFSTGEVVKFRPFTVKEEKILLIAQESDDVDQTMLALKQIISNCVYGVDVDKLPMFELEYLMLQLRSKSVNNIITFNITDPDTNLPVEIELDIDSISLTVDPKHSKEVAINDDMFLMMRYPRLEEVSMFKNVEEGQTKTLFNIMISCIDSIVDGDSVSSVSDYTSDEIQEFVDSLPGSTIEELKTFFETIPVLRFESKYVNSNGDDKSLVLEGMETFFI